MMKLGIFILMLFGASMTYGQSVSGRVTDSIGDICVGVEVITFKLNGEWEKGVMSSDSGNYSIPLSANGEYILEIFDNGESVYKEKISVGGDLKNDIQLNRMLANQVEGVTVVGKIPVIEMKIDRLVYNVEKSVASSGLDLLEALEMTPLVLVSENGISIVGKSGVAVMIDDKVLNLSGTDLVNYLRSIRSNDVSKIEVITAPPAKYNAEGNSGLINIVLKRNPRLGWNGALSSTYIQTTYAGIANNASINYRSKKFTSTLRLRHFDRTSQAIEDIDVVGTNSILSLDRRRDNYDGIGANVNLGYTVSKKVSLGLIYDIGNSHDNLDITNVTNYVTGNVQDSSLITYSEQRNSALTQTVSLYTDIAIDTLGKSLSLVGNYFSNLPSNVVNFQTSPSVNGPIDGVQNSSEIDYVIWSAQADYYAPLKWAEFETGAKYASFDNKSDVSYYNVENSTLNIDASRSNEFEYAEQNYAAYLSLTKRFDKGWAAKAGLRYEYSTIQGYSPTTNETNSFEYGSLFPTLYLSYRKNKNNVFSANYSKRINRPSFSALNPFRWYSNPFTYYTGNPELRPSFNDNVELSYGFKGMLNVSLYGQKTTNGYGRIVEVINGAEKVVNYANYLTLYSTGVNVNIYFNPTKWWECYSALNAGYTSSESSRAEVLPVDGHNVYYSSNNTFTLSKKSKVKAMLNFWHSLPARQGNLYSDHVSSLSAGIRFPFWQNRFQTNILVNDIFKGTQSRGEIYFANFTQNYNNYYDGRNFTVSITYLFGNRQVQGNQKYIQFDEQYRGN